MWRVAVWNICAFVDKGCHGPWKYGTVLVYHNLVILVVVLIIMMIDLDQGDKGHPFMYMIMMMMKTI